MRNLYRTCGIQNAINDDYKYAKEILKCFGKYTQMNWGDTSESDCRANDNAVYTNEKVIAKYITSKGNIFIITEWDRSATTILFAHER